MKLPPALKQILKDPSFSTEALFSAFAYRLAGKKASVLSDFLPIQKDPALADRLEFFPIGMEGEENTLTPEILSYLAERATQNRRLNGVFYTPFNLAKQLACLSLEALLSQNFGVLPQNLAVLSSAKKQQIDSFLAQLTVCDPAAGAGGLLVPFALELIQLRHTLNPQDSLQNIVRTVLAHNLYGADISAHAIQALKLRLALLASAHDLKPTPDLFTHFITQNSLANHERQSVWEHRFPQMFERGGFDLVLSNPPYVGQKNHRAVFEELRQNPLWADKVAPKSDLLYFFFYLALELLHTGGIAGFVTPPYFATATGAKKLRQVLQQRATFLHLQDFGEEHLFRAAAGHHTLLSLFAKGKTHIPCRVGNATVPQADLFTGENCYLQTRASTAGDFLQNLLKKMESCPRKLKDVAQISNGLMTGCDKISAAHLKRHPLPGVQKGTGVFVLSQAERDELPLTPLEQARLKPFFKNSDISAYTAAETPNKWLIDFFYPGDRELDFSQYPNLRAHLARFAPVLLARKQNNNGIQHALKRGIYWFGSVRRKMDFDTEKLVIPQRAKRNTFAFVSGPWYASSDVYFISAPQNISLWYLLALFNSAPYYAYLFHRGKRKGNLLELYSAPLSMLPVPSGSSAQIEQLERLARHIYNAKKANPQDDVSARQNQIDTLVGNLFGLTLAEEQGAQALLGNLSPKKL